MRAGYFTVRVAIPGQPAEDITTIAGGPMSAVQGVANSFRLRRYAGMPGVRFCVRSGWWSDGRRYEPRNTPDLARQMVRGSC